MKLQKQEASEWRGNGFGSTNATWVVAGTDIQITKLGLAWYAIENGKRIARGNTRADVSENLALKRPELNLIR